MKRYDIKCESLEKPEDWFYFEDSDHAVRYAKELWWDYNLVYKIIDQQNDFKKLYHQLLFEPYHERGKLDLIASQIRLQEDCLDELHWIIDEDRTQDWKDEEDLIDQEIERMHSPDPWKIYF